jgi:hypothetical protein
MFNTIHPILFFSISEKEHQLFNEFSINLGQKNTAQFKERYFRHIWMDHEFQIRNEYDDTTTTLPIKDIKNKSENIKIINSNRNSFKAIFEKQINSIYNIENTNFAVENNVAISSPQIVIYGSIDNPILSPLIIPLIQNLEFDVIKNYSGDLSLSPQVHLFLKYNTKKNNADEENESKIQKHAFFAEIETTNFSNKPYIWLLDNVNEQSIYLDDEQTLNVSICKFIELLFTNALDLISSIYRGNVSNVRPCLYSTFGYSSLTYPKNKIRDYLFEYIYKKELSQVTEKLNSQFEAITIKDEVIRFFQHPVFKNLSQNLSVNDKAENIFVPFKSDIERYIADERDKTVDRALSPIDNPDTISKVSTSELFHQINIAKEKYSNEVSLNFSQQMDFAKKRELENARRYFDETTMILLDKEGYGINYAILFSAVLANNKTVVESMLEGRFTTDIPTLSGIQENYRSLFIGNQINLAQKELKDYTDKVSNNLKLINQYNTEQANAEKTIENLLTNSDETNPKLVELNAKIENYKTQINNLIIENEELKLNIANLTLFIESERNEFDQDPTKESFKIEKTKKAKEELTELTEKVIPQIDTELSVLYQQKNDFIQKRKKFIFYQLLTIPILSLIFLLILSLFAYFKIHNDFSFLIKSIEISACILGIYYLIQLFKFRNLKKSFDDLLYSITQKLEYKKNRFLHYTSLINDCFQKDFDFERDLISFNMISPLIEESVRKQDELVSFKDYLLKTHVDYSLKLEEFQFESNDFDICVINKNDVNEIFNSSYQHPLIGSSHPATVKLSDTFIEYKQTSNLDYLQDSFTAIIDDLYKRKVDSETLHAIVFAESKIFRQVPKPDVFFQKLIGTSRPMLKTGRIDKDIPYCHDITVGHMHEDFKDYLKNLNVNNSIKIDSGNMDLFGLISIKSNIPAHIIYDINENENPIKDLVNGENKHVYFINDKSYSYSMNKMSNIEKTDVDDNVLPELLVFAIVREDVKYVLDGNCFVNDKVGTLGDNWDELIIAWNSHTCEDLRKSTGVKFKDMLSVYENNDYKELALRFIKAMLKINLVISKDHEHSLSVFYFSILKGSESGWSEVQSHFKDVKRKSI